MATEGGRIGVLRRQAQEAEGRWKRVRAEIGPDPMAQPDLSRMPPPPRWKAFREGKGWAAYLVHGPALRKGLKIAEAPEAGMLPARVAALCDAVRYGEEYGDR